MIPTSSLARKTRFGCEVVPGGASGQQRYVAAERGQSRSLSDRPSSLQSLRQEFSQAPGRAWGVRSGEESAGILLCVWEAAGSQRRHVFFSFFFLETGRQHCSEDDWSFSLLGTLCPSRHSRDHWNPYKQEGLCECIVYEVEEWRGKGFKKRNPWSTATCFSLDTCSDS